jgi:hypothetical protein
MCNISGYVREAGPFRAWFGIKRQGIPLVLVVDLQFSILKTKIMIQNDNSN